MLSLLVANAGLRYDRGMKGRIRRLGVFVSNGAAWVISITSRFVRRWGTIDRFANRIEAARRAVQSGWGFRLRSIEQLPTFYPNSYNYWRSSDLTFSAADRFPALVLEAARAWGASAVESEARSAVDFSDHEEMAERLGNLLDRYGSDKSSTHDYHYLYAAVFDDLGISDLDILEIGIGSRDPRVVSTMGRGASPGASLRAFRDLSQSSRVFGADIDTNALFTEDRIRTARVDQTDRESYETMVAELGCDHFDLIVDDGLHSLEANLNTLSFASDRLKPGGWVVVEDIPNRSLQPWALIAAVIGRFSERLLFFKGATAYVVAIKKRGG